MTTTTPIRLAGEHLGLREFRVTDAPGLHRIYGDTKATEHLSFSPRTLDQVYELVEGCRADRLANPRQVYSLAVTERGRDDLIGMARLAIERSGSGVIGFALHPSVWGRGYGTEVVTLLLALGFDRLSLDRVWGGRARENEASARTMQAAGMVEEGVVRGHVRLENGRLRDSVAHSILAPEWRELVRSRGASWPLLPTEVPSTAIGYR